MTNQPRLQDKVIIITGAGSGIGAASARRLAAEGASVVVADLRVELAHQVSEEITALGGNALAIACNVSIESDVESMVSSTVDHFGKLTGLFANAGTSGFGWIHETSLADWHRVINVNLTGAFLSARATLPHLIDNGAGVVVTTGSIASTVIGAGGSAASYAASKGGILQLTRQIAVDYADHGVRALCVCPGAVRTSLGEHVREDTDVTPMRLPRSPIRSPMHRAAKPEEVASVVAFAFSDDASFMTGSALFVDGGLTAI